MPKQTSHYGYWCWKCSQPIQGDAVFAKIEDDPSQQSRAHHFACAPTELPNWFKELEFKS